jgi:hypothetical protein
LYYKREAFGKLGDRVTTRSRYIPEDQGVLRLLLELAV